MCDNRFHFVPIPDEVLDQISDADIVRFNKLAKLTGFDPILNYGDLDTPNNSLPMTKLLPTDTLKMSGRRLRRDPRHIVPHLDPDFDPKRKFRTMGDFWSGTKLEDSKVGRLPHAFIPTNPEKPRCEEDTYVFFVQSLWKPDTMTYYDTEHMFNEIRRAQTPPTRSIYLTGVLKVTDIIDVSRLGWANQLPLFLKRNPELKAPFESNFHVRRNELLKWSRSKLVDDKLVVLIGDPNESRFFRKPIALKKGQTVSDPRPFAQQYLNVSKRDIVRHKTLTVSGCQAVLEEIRRCDA